MSVEGLPYLELLSPLVLVLAIAVDALGAGRVRAVMMPSPYTAEISKLDARHMAQRLGVYPDYVFDDIDQVQKLVYQALSHPEL